MRSFNQKNGEAIPPDLSLPAELSYLENRFFTENWLMSAGVVPDSSADTLLMYAYAQKGVSNVVLEIDQDESNNGKEPKIKYKVKLEPSVYLKWKAVKKAEAISNPIIRKVSLLALMKVSSPIGIEESIKSLAKDYLPKNYVVEVVIVDE